MKWVLIVILYTMQSQNMGTTTMQVEFSTSDACQAGRKAVLAAVFVAMDEDTKSRMLPYLQARAVCVKR